MRRTPEQVKQLMEDVYKLRQRNASYTMISEQLKIPISYAHKLMQRHNKMTAAENTEITSKRMNTPSDNEIFDIVGNEFERLADSLNITLYVKDDPEQRIEMKIPKTNTTPEALTEMILERLGLDIGNLDFRL